MESVTDKKTLDQLVQTNRFPHLEVINEAEEFDEEAIEKGLADESLSDEQEAEEREKQAATLAKKNGGSVGKSLETAESSMNALVPVRDEVYKNTKTGIECVFLTFQKRIAPYPDQERTFEFQILPQLLSYLAIDHSASDALDFGTVLVYSCKSNRHVEDRHYQHEIALVQQFSEDDMQGGNMTAGPSVSVSSK
ncbi:hypothetical protein BGZ98_001166 [Dissophora globulifera]|nr:hypothetical protein BGZ98_001166 [Dissophora globulifera]